MSPSKKEEDSSVQSKAPSPLSIIDGAPFFPDPSPSSQLSDEELIAIALALDTLEPVKRDRTLWGKVGAIGAMERINVHISYVYNYRRFKSPPSRVYLSKRSEITFSTGGQHYSVSVAAASSTLRTAPGGFSTPTPTIAAPPKTTSSDTPNVLAPMPGLVVSIAAKVGDTVTAGDQALVLEAMKMENAVSFTKDGKVKNITVAPGDQVEASQILIEVE